MPRLAFILAASCTVKRPEVDEINAFFLTEQEFLQVATRRGRLFFASEAVSLKIAENAHHHRDGPPQSRQVGRQ